MACISQPAQAPTEKVVRTFLSAPGGVELLQSLLAPLATELLSNLATSTNDAELSGVLHSLAAACEQDIGVANTVLSSNLAHCASLFCNAISSRAVRAGARHVIRSLTVEAENLDRLLALPVVETLLQCLRELSARPAADDESTVEMIESLELLSVLARATPFAAHFNLSDGTDALLALSRHLESTAAANNIDVQQLIGQVFVDIACMHRKLANQFQEPAAAELMFALLKRNVPRTDALLSRSIDAAGAVLLSTPKVGLSFLSPTLVCLSWLCLACYPAARASA